MNNPTQRAFIVFETLTTSGPLTLNELTMRIPNISRTGIHRALSHLTQMNWVRMRRGDNAWCVTNRLAQLWANAPKISTIPEHVDQYLPVLPKQVDIAIGHFQDVGDFVLLEATKGLYRTQVSIAEDPIALATLAGSEPDQTLHHINAWRATAMEGEDRAIVSGSTGQKIRQIRDRGYIWTERRQGCAFFVKTWAGEVGGIEVRARRPSDISDMIDWLAKALHVPS